MKKVIKISGFILGGVGLIIGVIVAYISTAYPKVSPPKELKIVSTPEMIERGNYLAHHVSSCMDCHSTRDWSKFSGPLVSGTEGKGGEKFTRKNAGVPGEFYSRNITPFNLKNWTDGELYRLITTGVTKDGKAIFPLMPYKSYAYMDPEDVKAIIAYVRTLPEKEGKYPDPIYDFPMNIILKIIPDDAPEGVRPDQSDTVKYGAYLVKIAGCGDCHTPMEKGKPIKGMNFAGGFEFQNEYGDIVRSANITQSTETGIGLWDEETFLKRFFTFRDSTMRNKPVKPHEFNSAMPWTLYSGMKDGDLKAIFRYLKTVLPVENKVEKFTAGENE